MRHACPTQEVPGHDFARLLGFSAMTSPRNLSQLVLCPPQRCFILLGSRTCVQQALTEPLRAMDVFSASLPSGSHAHACKPAIARVDPSIIKLYSTMQHRRNDKCRFPCQERLTGTGFSAVYHESAELYDTRYPQDRETDMIGCTPARQCYSLARPRLASWHQNVSRL